jgi:PAS domain S-box-containing protein
MVDAERRYTFANSTYAEILGLMSPDIVGQRVADVLSSLYEEQIRPRLDRAFAGERVTYELRRPTADGIRHYLVRYEPPKADDSVPQVVVVINDLTERKRAEEELSRTAEHLRLFAEHAPASIAMLDVQMRYVVVSQRWLADYGFVGQDLRGRTHYEMFPELSERWKQIHHRCLDGAVERAEEDLFERADGAKQWVRWEVRPWFEASGDTGGIVIFSEDITARKRAEARLRRLVDSNVQGVLFWNTKGCITDANDAFLSMFGYARSDVEAGRLDWAKMTPPQYADRDRQALQDLAVEGLCAPYEKEFFRQDGSCVPILIGSATFEDNPQEGVSFVLDLTERKQAEEKVRLLNAELEKRVVQRTSQLRTANTELKASDESLFASEERYRSLVESAKEYAILILDTQGNITTWNVSVT